MGKKARIAVKTEPAPKAPEVFAADRYEKFLPLLIVACGILAYHNSLYGPFIFDDRYHIVENARIRQLWPPLDLIAHSSRPVIYLSLAFNYALGGLNPLGYHLFNAAIHILGALVLYGIARRTFLSAPLERQWRASAPWLAALIASIWLVHPLQTESVTYTIQRGESMMGLFYLLTLYCAIRSNASPRGVWWMVAAFASCVLGMGCKGVMATAPIMVLLYDRVFLSKSWADLARRRWGLYAGLASTWLLYPLMLANAPADWKDSAGFGYLGVTPLQYAMTQPEVILHYLWLAVWPDSLCLDYGWPAERSIGGALPGLIVVGGLLAATLWAWRRNPPLGFLGAWFFIILIPTSSFIPIADLAVEHRMYLSLAAVVTLAVIGVALLSRETRVVGWLAALLAVVVLASLTIRRNADYSSELAIEADTAGKSPHNPRAQYDAGVALEHAGNFPDAIARFETALQENPEYVDALTNLGHLLSVSGRPGDAVAPLQHALRLKPDLAEAHNNLGHALVQQGKVQEAVSEWEQSIRLKPDFADPHNNLAIVLAQEGKLPEAIAEWNQAIRINPDFVDAYSNLAYALSQQGKIREAISRYEQALRLKPDYLPARINFARLLATAPAAQGGDPTRAVTLAEAACAGHRDASCLDTLAIVHAAANRLGKR